MYTERTESGAVKQVWTAEDITDATVVFLDVSHIVHEPYGVRSTNSQVEFTKQTCRNIENADGIQGVRKFRQYMQAVVDKRLPHVTLHSTGFNKHEKDFNTDVAMLLVIECYLNKTAIPVICVSGYSRIVRTPTCNVVVENVCRHCGKAQHNTPMPRCGRCKVTVYCDKSCQRAAWKQHKHVCDHVGTSQTEAP